MVRFTPNGLSVMPRQRAISLVRSSGVGWVSAVIKPSAPALATAATNSARPTHCMPPCTIGGSTPTSSVKRVLIMFPPNGFKPAHFRAGGSGFSRGRMTACPAKVYRAGERAGLRGPVLFPPEGMSGRTAKRLRRNGGRFVERARDIADADHADQA